MSVGFRLRPASARWRAPTRWSATHRAAELQPPGSPFKTAFQAVEVDAAVAARYRIATCSMKFWNRHGDGHGSGGTRHAGDQAAPGFDGHDHGAGRDRRGELRLRPGGAVRDQIVAPMSQGGDSGSLLVDADSRRAVRLLFAAPRRRRCSTRSDGVGCSGGNDMTGTRNGSRPSSAPGSQDAHEQELLSKRHVVGVGVGLRQRGGEYAVRWRSSSWWTANCPPMSLPPTT